MMQQGLNMKILLIHNFSHPLPTTKTSTYEVEVGLGILDSFALGIPMVTTDCKIHSPEIAYLESGRNGLMVADSEEAFIEGVERLLKNDEMRDAMAAECKKDAQRYSLEKMVNNFCEGVLKALNSPPKTSTYEV